MNAEEKARAAVEAWKQANGYDDLLQAYCDEVNRANRAERERDEARELVRGAMKWKAGDTSHDLFVAAVARWDEEKKR